MSTGSLTTTSYALLGLLAVKPWSTYELAQQMDRSLGRFWPRTQSKLYEEPKKLVRHGLARASEERVGRRTRTVYSITPKGRRALAAWIREPGAGPVLEFESLIKIFFAENGTKDDALANIAAIREWAEVNSAQSYVIGSPYLDGGGPFPKRMAQNTVAARFLNDFYAMVGEWARWATGVVGQWPEDPSQAVVTRTDLEETNRVAEVAAAGRVGETARP